MVKFERHVALTLGTCRHSNRCCFAQTRQGQGGWFVQARYEGLGGKTSLGYTVRNTNSRFSAFWDLLQVSVQACPPSMIIS